MKSINFSRIDKAKFFRTLNKRVNTYFKENNIKRTGNWKLYTKALIMFAVFLVPFILILTVDMPQWLMFILMAVTGVGMAGVGMNVIAADTYTDEATVTVSLFNGESIPVVIKTQSMEDVLVKADFISLHVPAQKDYVIDATAFSKMKKGAAIVNAARGGVIDEVALVEALDSGQLSFAALDTFENEPKPEIKLLMHDKISLTPHIGAATLEAQDRIGEELASQISSLLK